MRCTPVCWASNTPRRTKTCCSKARFRPISSRCWRNGTPIVRRRKPLNNNQLRNHVSADDHQGGPRTRMGPARCDPLLGRCLYRPPGVRRGRRGASARSRRVSRGNRSTTQLARRPARLHQTGRSAALLRSFGRGDGLDGQPLYGQPAAAPRRCLHPRRQSGIPPRPCRDGLLADTQTPLSARSGSRRRHRSLAAPPDPLRLLERNPPSWPIRAPTC